MSILIRAALGGALSIGVTIGAAMAQDAYRLPPQEIVDIVDAPNAPYTTLSPNKRHLLLLHREGLPPISEMARPMERLAGLRLDAETNGRHGPRSVIGLSVIDLETGEETAISTPDDVGLSGFTWSPDGSKAAFLVTDEDSIGVWVADMERAQAREIIDEGVNAVFSALDWMSDSETLLVTLTSDERGPRPERAHHW